ncbi:MAG: hypothetical protein AAGC46_04185, partial [Solirubrobacteraceae bacterium]|nr:hypothetical protein [Patulibacter sp.]
MVSVRVRSFLVALVALTLSFAGLTGAARADSLSVDFDSGPAVGSVIGDDYLASSFVKWLPADAGFRPERRLDAAQARSGSYVADVGASTCQDQGFDSIGCEFPHIGSYAHLTRTATTVTLYAGLFTVSPNIGVRLTGYNAAGTVVATSAVVPLPTSSLGSIATKRGQQGRAVIKLPPPKFTTPVSITSSAGDIASFRFEAVDTTDPDNGSAAIGADIGYDDLTLDFPLHSLPD